MIQANTEIIPPKRQVKAVGLLSGGLDSTLAAKIIRDLGVEVHGIYFAMPWGCCDKGAAQQAADQLGIKFIVLQLDERYLEMVRKPKHGYGSVMNPCVDCRIHMFSRAAQYMKSIDADFVFTGEVLGQRPMSQMRKSMTWIEEGTGLVGRLVRPLCAQNLEPTIPEQEGLIDRTKMLAITGRSRSEQLRLAEQYEITNYTPTGGGCLLTDENFARRMKDTLQHGYRNFRETVALKWGRHFRINKDFKIILGRDEEENAGLKAYAHPDDTIMELPDRIGPTLILKGKGPSGELLAKAAGFIQMFSKHKNSEAIEVDYWTASDPNSKRRIVSQKIDSEFIETVKI